MTTEGRTPTEVPSTQQRLQDAAVVYQEARAALNAKRREAKAARERAESLGDECESLSTEMLKAEALLVESADALVADE